MHNLFSRRIPAVFITVAILFVTVFSMSICANASETYSPRLSAPSSSNKYYYSNMNLFYKYGYGMPNCTAYAYGRAYELLGKEPKLCPYDAYEWYDYNKSNKFYSYGSTPKLGAIACWYYTFGGGHVAVVEKIENGKITFSNSAYNGTNFYLTTASISDANAGGKDTWVFQGYIYIGDFSDKKTSLTQGIYRTNVNTYLNMRSGAGTSYKTIASIANNVILNITEIESGNDGYTWGYTNHDSKNGWVALEYCTYLEPSPQPTDPDDQTPTEPDPPIPPNNVFIYGDINEDGEFTIDDVTLIQMYLSELADLSERQIKNSDVDDDGIISINDVSMLQKNLAYN